MVGDTIANTADIFFDFNYPIRTNTFSSVLVTDMDGDGYNNLEDCDDENANINPGAVEISDNGIDEDCDGMDFTTSTYELNGHQINIFPNPTSGILTVEIDGQSNYKSTIYDLSGREIFSESNFYSHDLSQLPNGLYLLVIQDLDSNKKILERITKVD